MNPKMCLAPSCLGRFLSGSNTSASGKGLHSFRNSGMGRKATSSPWSFLSSCSLSAKARLRVKESAVSVSCSNCNHRLATKSRNSRSDSSCKGPSFRGTCMSNFFSSLSQAWSEITESEATEKDPLLPKAPAQHPGREDLPWEATLARTSPCEFFWFLFKTNPKERSHTSMFM